MSWYYVENGQQAGPVSASELGALAASGRVSEETLVWKEGMENWLPYSQAAGVAVGSSEGLPSAAGQSQSAAFGGVYEAGSGPGAGLVQCSECGRYFGEDQVIRYGTANVCAGCKPTFVQRIKEGGRALAGDLAYAGFWIRLVARILDQIITGIVVTGIWVAVYTQSGGVLQPDAIMQELLNPGVLVYALTAIPFLYEAIMVSRYGATLGKLALNLKVVQAGGSPLDGKQPWSRAGWLQLLASVPFVGFLVFVGCIMVAFDEEKRGLHDRLLNTRVIRT